MTGLELAKPVAPELEGEAVLLLLLAGEFTTLPLESTILVMAPKPIAPATTVTAAAFLTAAILEFRKS